MKELLHVVRNLLDAQQRSITRAASFGSLWLQSHMMTHPLVTCVMTAVSGHASRQLSVMPSKASSASADVDAVRPWLEGGSTSAASSASSGSPASDVSYAAACHTNQVEKYAKALHCWQVARAFCHMHGLQSILQTQQLH